MWCLEWSESVLELSDNAQLNVGKQQAISLIADDRRFSNFGIVHVFASDIRWIRMRIFRSTTHIWCTRERDGKKVKKRATLLTRLTTFMGFSNFSPIADDGDGMLNEVTLNDDAIWLHIDDRQRVQFSANEKRVDDFDSPTITNSTAPKIFQLISFWARLSCSSVRESGGSFIVHLCRNWTRTQAG